MKKNSIWTSIVPVIGLAVGVSACGFHQDKGTSELNAAGTAGKVYGYTSVKTLVFDPAKCSQCHSDWTDSYASAKGMAAAIQEHVFVTGDMPKAPGVITDDQKTVLKSWLSGGTPENDLAQAAPGTVPVTAPAAPTPTLTSLATGPVSYAQISQGVLGTKCTMCHNANHAAHHVKLDSYADVVANLAAVQEQVFDKKKMPPARKPQLTDIELAWLKAWIDQGAPEIANGAGSPDKGGKADPTAQSPTAQVPSPTPSPVATLITFAQVNAQVISPRCASCHSGDKPAGSLTLLTYDQVKANLDKINRAVFIKGTMPDDGPLSDADQAFLKAWIDQGANL